jgi:hypothetical protein
LLEKLKLYQDAVEKRNFTSKLQKAELTGKKIRATQPKSGVIPPEYVNLHPIVDAAMRKQILPSLPIDLNDLGKRYSRAGDQNDPTGSYVINNRGYRTMLINGERLKKLDETEGESINKDIYVAATCYVIDSKEFSYPKKNPTKKALKLTSRCGRPYSERT